MKAKTFLPLFTGFYGSIWDDVDFYGEDEISQYSINEN